MRKNKVFFKDAKVIVDKKPFFWGNKGILFDRNVKINFLNRKNQSEF